MPDHGCVVHLDEMLGATSPPCMPRKSHLTSSERAAGIGVPRKGTRSWFVRIWPDVDSRRRRTEEACAGRRYLERAAALGQVDALKVLAYAFSKGDYSYQPSRTRAKQVKRALRRALSRVHQQPA